MKNTHWTSLSTLIVLGISALVLLLLSATLGIISVINLFRENANSASGMINAVVFGFQMLVVLVCAWFVLQKTSGQKSADDSIQIPFSEWQIIAVAVIVFLALLIGGVIAYAEIMPLSTLTLPFLTILAIAPPVWVFAGLGTRGINLGERWRVFGTIGLSMTLSAFSMIMLEVIVLGVIAIIAIIFLVSQPSLLQEVESLATLLKMQTSEQAILEILSPYISHPAFIGTLLFYISFLIPLIEEALKPLAVWLFAKHIETPAQGFALGVLSGAAFALVESLNAGAEGSASWSVVVGVRAGTSLLHIALSGLVGWGVISAMREKKIWRAVSAYLSAVLIHGIWNACAVGMAVSSVIGMLGKSELIFSIVPAALCGIIAIGLGMFTLLIISNQKLRATV